MKGIYEMKNINSLIDKKVKTSKPGIVHLFYPTFTFFNENNKNATPDLLKLAIMKNNVIFKGNSPDYVKKFININSKNDIIHVVEEDSKGIDIDLDNKYEMLQFIYNKHNRSYKQESKKIKEIINQLDDDIYYEFVKMFWVIGDAKFCLNYDKSVENKINTIIENTLTSPNKIMKPLTELLTMDISDYYYYQLEDKITNLFIDTTQDKQYTNEYLLNSIQNYEDKLKKFKNRYTEKQIADILTEYRTNVDNLKEKDIRLAILNLFTLLLS